MVMVLSVRLEAGLGWLVVELLLLLLLVSAMFAAVVGLILDAR